jgi:ferric-dicitrate binding protein FerR (iron transport regulator)
MSALTNELPAPAAPPEKAAPAGLTRREVLLIVLVAVLVVLVGVTVFGGMVGFGADPMAGT